MKLKNKWIVVFLTLTSFPIIALSDTFSSDEGINTNLYLKKFYHNNPYKKILIPLNDDIRKSSYIERQFGVRSEERYLFSPTKAATDGLTAIIHGKNEIAVFKFKELMNHSKVKEGALFFPFEYDFMPYYPYILKAPWVSAITQGLTLGLSSYLYLKTKDLTYKNYADRIFKSYYLPIKKGGFTRFMDDMVLFEEYPAEETIAVFNGAAVAALALYDYSIITGNQDALTLFKKYINWLEQNIEKYEKIDNNTGIILSYYSLAKKRDEILFRFYGEGEYLIKEVTLFAEKDNKTYLISKQRIGSNNDDLPTEKIYLFSDKEYTNWSKQTGNGRFINRNKGIYNHSPFYAVYEPGFERYKISISYKRLSNEVSELQAYDGKEYHSLGKLIGEKGKTVINTFEINPTFISSWLKYNDSGPFIESKYLDDNYKLLKLLTEISGSESLKKYLNRWENSVHSIQN